jgi:hypothetical protein
VKQPDAEIVQRLRSLAEGADLPVPTEALLRGAHRMALRRRATLISTTAAAVAVLVFAVGFLVRGGQSSSIPLAPMPTSAPSPGYTLAVQSREEDYTSPHIRLAPPDGTAKLSAATAWAAYRAHGTGYLSNGGETILKLVAYTNYGRGTQNPDGSVTPEIINRLAWVIEIPAVDTTIRGANITTPVFIFIDANDGRLIEAIRSSDFKL